MPPLRVEAALLRLVLPGPALRPGAVLAARVLERSGTHGTLSLAGTRLTAELPANLAAGDSLRLRVEEVGAERIMLRVIEAPPQAQQHVPVPIAAPVALPLPGGATATVRRREDSEAGGAAPGSWTIALAYESPALGTLGLRLTLDATTLRAEVDAVPGPALETASAGAERLREALAAGSERPVTVQVRPRREPVDVHV